MTANLNLTAVFEPAEEGGFIAFIEEIPGVNTRGETLEEAKENLIDALHLLMEANRELAETELSGREVIKEKLELV